MLLEIYAGWQDDGSRYIHLSVGFLYGFHEMAKSFAQNLRKFFLRTVALFLRGFALFFAQFAQNRKYFLRKLRMNRNFSFAQFFLRNLRKPASVTQNVPF